MVKIGHFEPVELVFAWTRKRDVPVIFGTNEFSFWSLTYVSLALRGILKSFHILEGKYPNH